MTYDEFLEEQQAEWVATIEGKGGQCPCCERFGKVYRRGINGNMARSLIWLCSHTVSGWMDVPKCAPKWVVSSNQLPTLKWWDLVERKPADKEDRKKHSGLWRPTKLGRRFASNDVAIPKYVMTYNDIVVRNSGKLTTISECFDTLFDYQEVMKALS